MCIRDRYLGAHKEINEVIFSGGDSLAIGHVRLAKIAKAIGEISNIKILRIHSRVPIIMPDIVDDELIGALKQANLPIFMVLHINHYNEITPDVKSAIEKLRNNGITLLSQSVLLRGVNDNAQILADSFNAVSYTHLDVYKRQAFNCLLIFCAFSIVTLSLIHI